MAENVSLFTQPETFKLASDTGSNPSSDTGSNLPTGQSAFEAGVRSAALQGGISLIGEGISAITEFGGKIAQVKDIRFAAKQEEIKGKQDAANLLEKLNDIQASNIVLAFAQGRQLTGSVVGIQQGVGLKAAHSISIAKINSKINSLALTRKANEAEALAKWEKDIAPFKIIAGVALTAAAFASFGPSSGVSSTPISEAQFLA